jgi:hypothetical protein
MDCNLEKVQIQIFALSNIDRCTKNYWRTIYKFTTFITYKENTSTVFSKYIDVLKVTLSQRLMYPKSILSVKEGSKSGLPLKIFILLETLGVDQSVL